jgi:hypothetical protein
LDVVVPRGQHIQTGFAHSVINAPNSLSLSISSSGDTGVPNHKARQLQK